jgi:hypothetical protein
MIDIEVLKPLIIERLKPLQGGHGIIHDDINEASDYRQ